MKKIIYLSALLALTACSNDELVSSSATDPTAIRFDVTTGNVTRDAELHSSSSKPSDFRLWSVVTPDFEDGTTIDFVTKYLVDEKVVLGSEGYSFDTGDKYWPQLPNTLDFFALHNNSSSTNSSVGTSSLTVQGTTPYVALQTTGIKLSDNADEQDDILYAVATNQSAKEDGTADDVNINFRHALALLEFQFANQSNNLYVEINKVTVTDGVGKQSIQKGGTLSFGTETNPQYIYKKENTTETTTETTDNYSYDTDCTWTASSPKVNTSAVYYSYGTDGTNSTTEVYYAVPQKDVAPTITEGLNSGMSNPQILVIPQTYVAGAFSTATTTPSTTLTSVSEPKRAHILDDESDDADDNNSTGRYGLWLVLHCRVYRTNGNDWVGTDKSVNHERLTIGYTDATNTQKNQRGLPVFVGKDSSGNLNDTFADLYVPLPSVLNAATTTNRWRSGYKYVYKLIFGSDTGHNAVDADNNPIFVTMNFENVTVDEWGEHAEHKLAF